jgi:heme exporter protein B
MSTVLAILRKDLRLELRTFETLPAMLLFSIATFVIFHFGLNRDTIDGQLAAGVLTVTLLFASLLGVNRLFVAEREHGGFDGFMLAPVERNSLLVAKAAAMYLFLVALELVMVPVFKLLLLGTGLHAGLLLVLALADLGLAVIGTFVSAVAIHTRARDLIAPIIGLPLLIPLLIATARGIGPTFAVHAHGVPGKWLLFLALYDAVFALLAYAVFDFLLED